MLHVVLFHCYLLLLLLHFSCSHFFISLTSCAVSALIKIVYTHKTDNSKFCILVGFRAQRQGSSRKRAKDLEKETIENECRPNLLSLLTLASSTNIYVLVYLCFQKRTRNINRFFPHVFAALRIHSTKNTHTYIYYIYNNIYHERPSDILQRTK